MNLDVMCLAGFDLVGAHPRELVPSARTQQRRKLDPSQPWVPHEWALVARKPLLRRS
jgi:hypothetical protein